MGVRESLPRISATLLALLAVAAPLPFILPEYMITTLIMFFIWAVVAQSWNLVWGIAGVWTLGQMAIFAMAGYVTGWLILHLGLSPYLAAVLGIVGAVAASVVMALPSIRLRGVYVILMTISFHEIFRILLTTDTSGFTGGIFGLPPFEGFVSGDLGFGERTLIQYYIALAMLLVTAPIVWCILHSRLGLAFKAMGQNPLYAAARGISIFRTQVLAFIISGVLAGAAGAYWAQYFGTMQPAVLSYDTMVMVFAMMVVGGWASFSGPILGAFIMVWLSELLHATHELRELLLGLVIFVVSVTLPDGFAPKCARLLRLIREKAAPPRDAAARLPVRDR